MTGWYLCCQDDFWDRGEVGKGGGLERDSPNLPNCIYVLAFCRGLNKGAVSTETEEVFAWDGR